MALSVVKEDSRFRVEWQGNSTDWLPETASNRKVVLVFLRWLRDENGKPVFTFQELSKVVDSEKRQESSGHVEEFRECSYDFLKYLTCKRKIDSEVVEAVSQELHERPLSAINELQHGVNTRLDRKDISSANIAVALGQISCHDIRDSVRMDSMHVSDPSSIRKLVNPEIPVSSIQASERWTTFSMALYYYGVLIGGPGQGKSTLGQFIAQIHRAYILNRVRELGESFAPDMVRIPFRVALKDYAQWIADSKEPRALEQFLARLVEDRAGRDVSSEQIQEILKENPTVLILDGLDEVTDRDLRTRMLTLLSEFIGRCEDVLKSGLQIIATSRPTGYSDQFDPSRFLHLIPYLSLILETLL